MIIYPAIDIMDGKVVRLKQGEANQMTQYGQDPVEVAKAWEAQGAQAIHVVDLEGAFEGETKNQRTIEGIIKGVKIPVQVGGGLRSIEAIERVLEMGAARAIIGTAVVENQSLDWDKLDPLKDRLMVSLDGRQGFVATRGWVHTSGVKVLDLASSLCQRGLTHIVYTDISKDGMLAGPDLEGIRQLVAIQGAQIVASGGISQLEDVARVKALGVAGVIVGKALYEGRLKLEELLALS